MVLQRLARVRDAEGVESIRGELRAEFAVGQRHAVLHVGFCPPMARLPVVEARVKTIEGSVKLPAEVRVVQAFCHGARLEVKLAEAAKGAAAALIDVGAKPQAAE